MKENELMKFIKESSFIRANVGMDEILTVVAEEAAELSHAALKLRRAINDSKDNPTTVTESAARENLIEEYADLHCALQELDFMDSKDTIYKFNYLVHKKLDRWYNRICSKQQKAGELV